jgi:hypothetical protein
MKNLFWLPLDLPKFEYSNEIIADFKGKFIPANASAFLAQKLTEDGPPYATSKWRNDLTESQSKLKEYIDMHLPFDALVNIKVHHPHRKGTLHVDFAVPRDNLELFKNNKENEPCGYRLVLSGERSGDLTIKNSSGDQYPKLPNDTDWYAIGSTNVLHSITHSCPDRYIIFCHGWINREKHDLIISKSLEKYKDYAIWF